MIERLTQRLQGIDAHLVLVALLHVDLVLWALFIECEKWALRPNLNTAVWIGTVAFTALVLLRGSLRRRRWTWCVYLGVSLFALQAGQPYSSNLYFLWVYIDIFLVALFFGVPTEERKALLIAGSARVLIVCIFAMAVLQKVTLRTFLDGSFYYQAFSSGFFGMQIGLFAERFFGQPGLTAHVLSSGIEVVTALGPALEPGSTVAVPIVQSPALLSLARAMALGTVVIESACALLFAFNRNPRYQAANHLTLFAFLCGTYLVVPIVVDWGWAFATLGMATATGRFKLAYLLAVVVLMIVALLLGPETVRLVGEYSRII